MVTMFGGDGDGVLTDQQVGDVLAWSSSMRGRR
jgi:hypothetical protein